MLNNTLKGTSLTAFRVSLLVSLLTLGLSSASFAEEPEGYVSPIKIKKYSKLPSKLIKVTQPIDVAIVNGEAYIQGDIWVGSESYLDQYQSLLTGQSVTVDESLIAARWSGGVVPFVILDGMSESQRKVVIDAMNYVAENTNVCFRPRRDEARYVKFKKLSIQELGWHGGQSYLGRCDWCLDGQEIRLSKFKAGTVRHEIGHALGLNHEHTRQDRDQFVEILWGNVEPSRIGNFVQVDFAQTDVGRYDFKSLMHYRSTAAGKVVKGVTLQTMRRKDNPSATGFGSEGALTPGDIAGINAMYPTKTSCARLSPLLPGELEVGQSVTKTIRAAEPYNYTGVFLRKDQKFRFTTASPEWNNGNRETTADGYPGGPLDVGRRHVDINVMALVGEIFGQATNPLSYTGTYFRIGTSKTWTATKSGFLVTFANDCLPCYGDNSRVVTLTIRRIE
jgi:astacin